MSTIPVMTARRSDGPKRLRPSLDVKLASGWRYEGRAGLFISSDGKQFSPREQLPKGTKLLYMVPQLARAEGSSLSADERNLARHMQIVFPKGTAVDSYLAAIRKWHCVEQVQPPPQISLP
jgi:hypothetical protein